MPIVGLFVGHVLGHAVGGVADYFAAAALFALGAWMLIGDEETEGKRISALVDNSGLALIGLGISISLDELAMGFTIGLLHLSIPLAVILIGAQAFIVAQLGLRLGSRLGEAARESAEKIAGLALIGLGLLILIEKLR